MQRFGQGLFPIAILTLLVGMTFWLQSAMEIKAVDSDSLLRHDLDFFVEKFQLRRFAPSGELRSTLVGEKMVHYPDDETTIVSEPRMVFLKGPRPTRLSSKQALVAPDGREVAMVGDVRGVRDATEKDSEIVFTTSHLTVFPDDEIVRTTAAVTLTQDASIIRGVGLEGDNKTQIYQLLSQVNSTIEKKHQRLGRP